MLDAPQSRAPAAERRGRDDRGRRGRRGRWETATPRLVSWFPAGAAASAVASPAPGTTIGPHTPITLTFSKPDRAGARLHAPPAVAGNAGTWHTVNSHTIIFQPDGVRLRARRHRRGRRLPSGVRLVGGQQAGSSSDATWTVPAGSTLRLQQLLAQLGYLPLQLQRPGAVGTSLAAQEAAAINPRAGSFDWRYGNVPVGAAGLVGARRRRRDDPGRADGVPERPRTRHRRGRRAGRVAVADQRRDAGKRSTFGYTFVIVSVELAAPDALAQRPDRDDARRSTPGSRRRRPRPGPIRSSSTSPPGR